MPARTQYFGKLDLRPYEMKQTMLMEIGDGWFKRTMADSRPTSTTRVPWAFSCWFYKTSTAAANVDMGLIGYYASSNSQELLAYNTTTDGRIGWLSKPNTTSIRSRLQSNGTVTSSIWRHLYFTSNAYYTGSYYVDPRMWINGVEQTASYVNSTVAWQRINGPYECRIGQCNSGDSGSYILRGYIGDILFIDGAIPPVTDLGYIDPDSGLWLPRDPTETLDLTSYGKNTCFLDFRDKTNATTLGYDHSGKGNNWTPVSNVSPSNVTDFSPTNP